MKGFRSRNIVLQLSLLPVGPIQCGEYLTVFCGANGPTMADFRLSM